MILEMETIGIKGPVTGDTPINLLNDVAAKAILSAKESRMALARFISAGTHFTKEQIMNADIKSIELSNLKQHEKVKKTDLTATISKEEKLIIEINQKKFKGLMEKNARYCFSLAVTETLTGQIESIRTTIINLDKPDFFGKGTPCYLFHIQDDEGTIENRLYTSYHFIVANRGKLDYNKDKEKEIRLMLEVLSSKTLNELKELVKGDEDYMSLAKKAEEYFQDGEFINWYNTAEGEEWEKERYRETGYEEGREEGLEKGRREIIKKMKDGGMNIQDISNILKISKERITMILREN